MRLAATSHRPNRQAKPTTGIRAVRRSEDMAMLLRGAGVHPSLSVGDKPGRASAMVPLHALSRRFRSHSPGGWTHVPTFAIPMPCARGACSANSCTINQLRRQSTTRTHLCWFGRAAAAGARSSASADQTTAESLCSRVFLWWVHYYLPTEAPRERRRRSFVVARFCN